MFINGRCAPWTMERYSRRKTNGPGSSGGDGCGGGSMAAVAVVTAQVRLGHDIDSLCLQQRAGPRTCVHLCPMQHSYRLPPCRGWSAACDSPRRTATVALMCSQLLRISPRSPFGECKWTGFAFEAQPSAIAATVPLSRRAWSSRLRLQDLHAHVVWSV